MTKRSIVPSHPGYPKVKVLAERLGIEPHEMGAPGTVVIATGPNGSGPYYDIVDIIMAAIDRIDAATP